MRAISHLAAAAGRKERSDVLRSGLCNRTCAVKEPAVLHVSNGAHVNFGTFCQRTLGYRWRTDESDDTLPYTHHPYAYALSNPVLNVDPAGTCAVREDGEDCHKRPRPLGSTSTAPSQA